MTQEITLEQRLAVLPTKLAIPFHQLLAKELISKEALHTILDAGELADDSNKLVGFTIAYFHMTLRGIPVADTINMAKNRQRKINLDWSEKRWKTEHDRLSRLEALSRLAKDNTEYDVSSYAPLLPKKFDGYLIKSSRRLGMEGLRQRHCVASYHHQILSSRCAIAAVFVEQQRWTVELLTTGEKDAPLRIGQIKTRLNGSPTQEIKNRIYEQLGVNFNEPDKKRATPASSYMNTLRRLLPLLREQNIDSISVRFEGCGDCGSIEEISYFPNEKSDVQNRQIQYQKIGRSLVANVGWVKQLEEVSGSVNQAVEDLTYDYLEETGVDWYNNDGGYGELTIEVIDGTVSLGVDVRYTDATNEFESQRDILTGEEI